MSIRQAHVGTLKNEGCADAKKGLCRPFPSLGAVPLCRGDCAISIMDSIREPDFDAVRTSVLLNSNA
jgi:hypothetical protein